MHAPAAIAASATAGLYVSTETTAPSSPTSRSIERHDARDLDLDLDRRAPRDRRLAADVDDVRALREQRAGALDARVEVGVARRRRENESGDALTIPISHGRVAERERAARGGDA